MGTQHILTLPSSVPIVVYAHANQHIGTLFPESGLHAPRNLPRTAGDLVALLTQPQVPIDPRLLPALQASVHGESTLSTVEPIFASCSNHCLMPCTRPSRVRRGPTLPRTTRRSRWPFGSTFIT